MLFPEKDDQRSWMLRLGAIGAGFSVASFGVGSMVIGRLATPLGLFVSLAAGAVYALGIRAVYTPGRVGPSLQRSERVGLSAPTNPADPR